MVQKLLIVGKLFNLPKKTKQNKPCDDQVSLCRSQIWFADQLGQLELPTASNSLTALFIFSMDCQCNPLRIAHEKQDADWLFIVMQ